MKRRKRRGKYKEEDIDGHEEEREEMIERKRKGILIL